MSAINDALRRASGAAPAAEPPPLPSLHAVMNPAAASDTPSDGMALSTDPALPPLLQPPPAKSASLPIFILVALLFAAAATAGVYLWKRNAASKTSLVKNAPPSLTRAQVQKTAPAAAATEPRPEEKPPAQPVPLPPAQTVTPAPVKEAAATAVPVTPPVSSRPSVQFPPLRLQGIYYKPSNPSVMINNRTLFVGDQVQGVTVASIDASSVTLVLSGQTNVLTLR